MAGSPGGASIDKVSVKVVPDTSTFADDLRADLERISKDLGIKVKITPDTSTFNTKATQKKLTDSLSPITPAVKPEVDDASVSKAKGELNGLFTGLSLGSAGLALVGPALGAAAIAGGAALAIGIAAGLTKSSPLVLVAWHSLTDDLTNSAKAAAAPLAAPLSAALGSLQTDFDREKPFVKAFFADSAAYVPIFTTGIEQLSNQALPGLTSALKNGVPAAQGLVSVFQSVGIVIGQVATASGTAAPAIGSDMKDLAGIVTGLGGTVSSLISTGSQFATGFLPALGGGLSGAERGIGALFTALGPIDTELGAVAGAGVNAYGSFRLLSAVTGPTQTGLGKVQTKLASGAASGNVMASATKSVVGGLSSIAGAVPFVGAAISGLQGIAAQYAGTASGLSQQLLQGGDAAKTAADQIAKNTGALLGAQEAFGTVGKTVAGFFVPSLQDTLSALDPLQQKQALYNLAVAEFGTNSKQAAGAAKAVSVEIGNETVQANAAAGALNMVSGGSAAASSNVNTLAADIKVLADNSATGQGKISALQDAIKLLGDNGKEASNDAIALLYQDVNNLTGSLPSATGKLLGLNGQFDLTSVKGETARSTVENMAGTLGAFNQTLVQQGDSQDFANTQTQAMINQLAGPLASQLGLTKQQTINLINTFYQTPASINTKFNADTGPALKAVGDLQSQINGLHGATVQLQANILLTDNGNVPPQSLGQLLGLSGKASGGPVKAGTPYIVGEKGYELFVPSVNGTIVPHNLAVQPPNTRSALGYSAPSGSAGADRPNVTQNITTSDPNAAALASVRMLDWAVRVAA